MKRILLLMPNYYGFDEVIIKILKEYSECEVFNINYDVGFKYTNIFQRIKNAFSKLFLNKNLKPKLKEVYFLNMLDSYSEFDFVIVNRPDILPNSVLDLALNISKENILILWDSLEKVPISKEIISKFNNVYSFDKKDCLNFGFKKTENFHYNQNFYINEYLNDAYYDVVFLGTVDNRIEDLKKIMHYIHLKQKSVHAYLHVPKNRTIHDIDNVSILKKIVPFKYSYTFANSANIILDLAHKNQSGLSFRVFEAMKLNKKLITTNVFVREYEFYNPHNIFVIDDIDNIDIPEHFFASDYMNLPESVLQKYSAESWVNKILKNE